MRLKAAIDVDDHRGADVDDLLAVVNSLLSGPPLLQKPKVFIALVRARALQSRPLDQRIQQTMVAGLNALLGDASQPGDGPAWHFQVGLTRVNVRLEPSLNAHLRLWKFDPRRSNGESATSYNIATAADVHNTLVEIERSVLTSAALEQHLAALLDDLLEIHQAPMGDLQLFNARTGKLRMIEYRGFPSEFAQQFMWLSPADGGTVCAKAFRDQSPTFVRDVAVDSEFAEVHSACEAHGFRAVHSVPLEVTGKPIGVVSCHLPQANELKPTALREIDRVMDDHQRDLARLMQ